MGLCDGGKVEQAMRQCLMRNGNRFLVAWIPATFARKGKYVKLRGENGWCIEMVGTYQKVVTEQRGYFAGGVGRP